MFIFEGVGLRKLGQTDLYALWKLKQESWFGTHSVSIINLDDQKKWFESLDRNPTQPRELVLIASTPIENCKDGFDITNFGIYKISNIHWVNRTADVGWDVFEGLRGKGLGRKLVAAGAAFCFEILNLRRLTAEILSDNQASRKCALAAGFMQEGYKREAIERSGVTRGSFVFGLLSKEWFNARRIGETDQEVCSGDST